MKQHQTRNISIMFTVIAIGMVATVAFTSNQMETNNEVITTQQIEMETEIPTYVVGTSFPQENIRPEITVPFSITVNGIYEPTVITAMKGETVTADVSITSQIPGKLANLEIVSALPECGTMDVHMPCISQGLQFSMSKNKITESSDVMLTIHVPKDMPVGLYPYSVVVSAEHKIPEQAEPVNVGHITTFGVNVTE